MSIEAAFFGTLSRDAERKTSKTGKPYLRVNVRVGDSETTQWVNVMAFDEKAIEAADRFVKGARCYIEGKLSLDEWAGQDGAKRHGLSVMSWHCRLAQIGRNRPKKNGETTKSQTSKQSADNTVVSDLNDEIPF
jgi:single-stranded DNA-binding protein